MGVFLAPSDLVEWVSAPAARLEQAIEDIESEAKRVAPTLFSDTSVDRAAVVGVLRMAAVSTVVTLGGTVRKRVTGPFSIDFADGATGLSSGVVARLRELAGTSAEPPAGTSLGNFPPPGGYDDLFRSPTHFRGY